MLQFQTHDHVRKAVEVAGLSVGEFAEALGVSRNTVSRWLNGRARPSTAQMIAISVVTGVPLEWLTQSVARPERLELPTFCSVADMLAALAVGAIVEPAHASTDSGSGNVTPIDWARSLREPLVVAGDAA